MAERLGVDYAVLRGVVGATLRGLARDQYLFNGRPSRDCDGALEMRFDGRAVLLFLARDGESVRAAAGELEIAPAFVLDSGDACAWERVDLGLDSEFGRLIGRAILRVEAVIDAWPEPVGMEVVRGWVVQFVGDDFLAYLNVGDDSRLLLNHLPLHPDPAIRTWVEVVGE
jgi:hypothetical protein